MKVFLRASYIAAICLVATSGALAQQRIHAVSGTVTSVNAKIAMTEITTDDGSSGHFEWLKKSDGSVDFDKSVSADAVAVDKFTAKGTHVILYYCGMGQVRTAVAVHDLGAGTIAETSGTVVKLNKHDHLLTIKNGSGTQESFHLDPKTVADTENGVAEDFKFDYSKGQQVQVTALQANGSETALLIAPAM
jgi:hypothetical protein